jgi:helicase
MGVNTPASAVVIVGLEHPGPAPYTVAEYKNIVGRAGRLGHAERGESYLLAVSPHEEHQLWTRYVRGVPEELRSHFFSPGSDPRSLLLRVLAAANFAGAEGMTAEELVEFIEGSFAAYQEQRAAPNWRYDRDRLYAALGELESHSLIEPGERGGYHLTELGRVGGESGLAVESLIRLVDAPRPCRPDQLNSATLVTATQRTIELDDVFFPVNKRSTIQEAHNWAAELRTQNTAGPVMHMLSRGIGEQHEEWARAKKAVACLLWMTDRPLLDIERVLTQHGSTFGGVAGPIQSVAGRTFDVLPTVARIAEILHPGLDLGEKSRQILVRLENGIPSALVEIASQTSTRLSRADYLRLLQAGVTTIAQVATATDAALLASVGGDAAKLGDLRRAVEDHGRLPARLPTGPLLPPPED